MRTISQYVCAVIPPHVLRRVAEQTDEDTRENARSTLEHMRELANERVHTFIEGDVPTQAMPQPMKKRRNVYDAGHQRQLPGRLAMSEHKRRVADVDVNEAYDGSGATFDFFAEMFGRRSIDGRGMRLDSTVHYGTRFENAMWNGRQMIYGDGDGRIFNRFTVALDVIAHELTHGVTQYTAALGYAGETGAINEHISDAFGIMVKQYTLGQSAHESDWLIGAGLFGPAVNGRAVRSMAAPGTAYDDPILGRDPQPAHMRDYVDTGDDNGGVHINSGIPNHAFYLAAVALGGRTWQTLGRVWYVTLTERLTSDADFSDFARATVDVAGELFAIGGIVQKTIADAWSKVGISVPILASPRIPIKRQPPPLRRAALRPLSKWRQRPAR